jgi:hypothetical protein
MFGLRKRLGSPASSPAPLISSFSEEHTQSLHYYRVLNSVTVKDRSPLPNVDEPLCTVSCGKFFSILDQTNAFFQTRMREANIPLTAVKTPWGLLNG